MIPGLLLLTLPALRILVSPAPIAEPPTPLCGYQLPPPPSFCQSSVAAFPLSSIGPMHDAALTVTVSRWSTAIIANNKIMQKKELASGWIVRATSIRELAPNLALLDQASIPKRRYSDCPLPSLTQHPGASMSASHQSRFRP
ncbi:hypothetical protein BJY01DRAFT_157197 [Aspergillus pseudoustus]|uniref:Secreted protein n=1 Tax=Aspergillus pseudoustus TaxID=1810923 RepID=A0ABR4K873_9EURO